MKILFITPYPFNAAPSQRFRFEQYLSFLKEHGIVFDQRSFLDQATWSVFYKKGNFFKKITGVLKGILNRHLLLFKLHNYDLLFIHREACFIGPAYFEWIYSKIFRKKIIYDFDDAIWLRDVSQANTTLSWLKRSNKTGKIISYSHTVIAGNDYLASYARNFNENVVIIPTTIDDNYHVRELKNYAHLPITIGWTGSVTTNRHLETLIPVLIRIKDIYKDKVAISMISNTPIENKKLKINFILWNKSSEIEDLSTFDIGIMPLPDDEWSRGKCGFKGLQYMAIEIPTIMSPVGVNTEIIQDNKNGFLASTEEEWITKLSLLIESAELREQIGKAGRKTIEEKYSVEANKEKYLSVIKTTLNG